MKSKCLQYLDGISYVIYEMLKNNVITNGTGSIKTICSNVLNAFLERFRYLTTTPTSTNNFLLCGNLTTNVLTPTLTPRFLKMLIYKVDDRFDNFNGRQ